MSLSESSSFVRRAKAPPPRSKTLEQDSSFRVAAASHNARTPSAPSRFDDRSSPRRCGQYLAAFAIALAPLAFMFVDARNNLLRCLKPPLRVAAAFAKARAPFSPIKFPERLSSVRCSKAPRPASNARAFMPESPLVFLILLSARLSLVRFLNAPFSNSSFIDKMPWSVMEFLARLSSVSCGNANASCFNPRSPIAFLARLSVVRFAIMPSFIVWWPVISSRVTSRQATLTNSSKPSSSMPFMLRLSSVSCSSAPRSAASASAPIKA
mmetsp:Transcript_2908/g.6559  ORF Transcript_2908/g.6559 Transcript_2908/m.6559 type:complete len:267 (+) Transcript_2908:497-1297(+)